VHNDVDYVTNETIKDIIGIEIDDKIVASYQNFDGTKPSPQKNDNLIVVTYRKIFFTYYDGYNWVVLNKQIFELEKIGVFRNDVNSYLKLVFSDGTSLGLRLELDKKLTTNPQLFIKQFLSVLDSSLTGNSVDSPVKRRRVSLDDKKINSDKESPNPVRQIELNPELISEIKKSEKTASVRNIDI
jgi:hypothetical protein